MKKTKIQQQTTDPSGPKKQLAELLWHYQGPGYEHAVAVVGLSGRYPKAETLAEFWDNMKNGTNCITEIPAARWHWQQYYNPDKSNLAKSYSKWGGFVRDIDLFDAAFFKITPVEAEGIDPQERLFLETAWNTLEDAGYTRKSLNIIENKVGVFAGVMNCNYEYLGAYARTNGTLTNAHTSYWSIANRVSYFFDLNGPSLAIDTACSSSLTALHLACESINKKECRMAIAGGVNLIMHPVHLARLSQANMLSSDGLCKTFGDHADGFVDAEGVGAVLLRPLLDALLDGDNIYGVIRATAINAGGKTSGYTVPNPKAQAEVIVTALQKAHIDPRTITYVEAHGTGTELGDPIEISGLENAFSRYTNDKQFCAIGSVKSNIGHTESASGIAGLTKVLLQLKYKKLAPSINSEILSKKIKFSTGPFFVQQTYADWEKPRITMNNEEKTVPRRAAVSSFGAGGSNAHVIVEECEFPRNEYIEHETQAILFSAKSAQGLDQVIKKHLDFINSREFKNEIDEQVFFQDMAYTLQVGREAMEHRVAIIVSTLAQLQEKLGLYVQGDREVNGLYCGVTGEQGEKPDETALSRLLDSAEVGALGKLWAAGAVIHWHGLYKECLPNRLSLPTYVFAKERFWIENFSLARQETVFSSGAIHPYVDINVSTLEVQRFKKLLNGNEHYLEDHVIHGEKILPGMVGLAMIRAACELSLHHVVIKKITNIMWIAPVVVGKDPVELLITLVPSENFIECAISSENSGVEKTYIEAEIAFTRQEEPGTKRQLDIGQITKRCTSSIEAEIYYRYFRAAGILYGHSLQTIKNIQYNAEEVLACLQGDGPSNAGRGTGFNPALLDGALQSVMILLDDNHKDLAGFLPYALGSLEVLQPLQDPCLVYATRSEKWQADSPAFNLSMTDAQGAVLITITDFVLKRMNTLAKDAPALVYATGEWQVTPVNKTSHDTISSVMVFDYANSLAGYIKTAIGKNVTVTLVCPGEEFSVSDGTVTMRPDDESDYQKLFAYASEHAVLPDRIAYCWTRTCVDSIYRLLYLSKGLLAHDANKNVVLLYIFAAQDNLNSSYHAAVSGFAKSVYQEDPRLFIKTIHYATDNGLDGSNIEYAKHVLDELASHELDYYNIRYAGGSRQAKQLREITAASNSPVPGIIKEEGVYIITGGNGKLGLAFARYLADHFKAKIVLSGRSAFNKTIGRNIESIQSPGSEIIYVQADMTDPEAVKELVKKAKSRFRTLNGVIHSAGVICDSLFVKKTTAEIDAVLGPKISGAINLDDATSQEPLDFFVLFSSISSVLGNAGQSDYAYANTFLDYFAAYRDRVRERGKRSGKTVSINWPYWQQGGMTIDQGSLDQLNASMGMVELDTDSGMTAFTTALQADTHNLLVLKGSRQKIKAVLLTTTTAGFPVAEGTKPGIAAHDINGPALLNQAIAYLRKAVSSGTKIPVEKIDPREPLEKYGIDSVLILNITRQLESDFGRLAKTLFFQYQSIAELAQYFISKHHAQLQKLFGGTVTSTATRMRLDKTNSQEMPARFAARISHEQRKSNAAEKDDIAIIGMHGRFPMAEDLDQFWANLVAGKDSITEIPYTRWDYNTYYAPDKDELGMSYSKWGGFIADVEAFDPLFFQISPRDAAMMDPQERLFLETAYHVMEDAGYTRKTLQGQTVGVFVGVMWTHYQLFTKTVGDRSIVAGSSISSVANRVSYTFNFQGPSIGLDTMCSSSLTAIALGCDSLRLGDSDLVIAGGVNVTIHPHKYKSLSQGKFASIDGRCRAFGEGGSGYVPGEGVGAVMLKPLKKALQDRDNIHAIIKGHALNHGGKTNGYSVPNPNSQGDLVRKALERAHSKAIDISYIEAHGTGTSLGDPIEITGLMEAFGQDNYTVHRCAIGSVKSNIGHLESAAGIAGLIKIILQMRHKTIVASLHSATLNPFIDFAHSPFYVPQQAGPWSPDTGVRTAGLSAFGAGGSNAHLVVEEYGGHVDKPVKENNELSVFLLSARSKDRLLAYAEKFIAYIDSITEGGGEVQFDKNVCSQALTFIREAIADIVQVSKEEISPDDNFTDYGLDAVHYAALAERLKTSWGIVVGPTDFTEYPSAMTLAEHIFNINKQELCAYYAPSKQKSSLFQKNQVELEDVVYTLQAGREHYEQRLAILCVSLDELKDRLGDYVNDQDHEHNFIGSILDGHDKINSLVKGKTGPEFIKMLVANREYPQLAQLWALGADIDWDILYAKKPRRVSLPLYPFARERYWITETFLPTGQDRYTSRLGPLLDSIRPTIVEQGLVFTRRVQDSESLVRDHKINGSMVLPGVAYVEMLSEAMAALGLAAAEYRITNLYWLAPLLVTGAVTDIDLQITKQQEHYRAEVTTNNTVHCRAELVRNAGESNEHLPIAEIIERCKHEIDSSSLYSGFAMAGIDYGPYYACIKKLYTNKNESIGLIKALPALRHELVNYSLHPAVMDSALHTVMPLLAGDAPMLPFSIESIERILPLQTECYAYSQLSGQGSVDIRITDRNGTVLVKLNRVVLRESRTGKRELYTETSGIHAEKNSQLRQLPSTVTGKSREVNQLSEQDLTAMVIDYARQKFSLVLGIAKDAINERFTYEKYGVDSLAVMEITRLMERDFGPLPTTMLFEHSTIKELAQYLLAQHRARVEEKIVHVDSGMEVLVNSVNLPGTNHAVQGENKHDHIGLATVADSDLETYVNNLPDEKINQLFADLMKEFN